MLRFTPRMPHPAYNRRSPLVRSTASFGGRLPTTDQSAGAKALHVPPCLAVIATAPGLPAPTVRKAPGKAVDRSGVPRLPASGAAGLVAAVAPSPRVTRIESRG